MRRIDLLSVTAGVAGLVGVALAQETPPPAPEKPAEERDVAPPPSLDELLGIEEETTDDAREAAEREAEDELTRELNEEAITDAFAAAIEKMRLSADFLDIEFDPGLGTQRIQEEILRKLDEFIDLAKKQQQSGGGSSSSSSSQSSEEQQQSPGQQPPSEGDAQQRQQGSNDSNAQDPPAPQHGDINTVLEETRTEWGGLPPRTRDELLQGYSDKYSSLYDRLTREYYRRLAEEGG